MKRKKTLFGISFFCTLAVVLLLCGFAVADLNAREAGYGGFIPMARATKSDALHYEISILGEERVLSLEWLNTAAKYGQKLFPAAPPKLRLLVKLAAAGTREARRYLE